MKARYDGIADWYDEYNAQAAGSHGAELARLLGPGSGRCLDLGCGTGHYVEAIRATGRVPVGLDHSADQLRLARRGGTALVRADAAALPFADAVFPTVVAMWLSTDVDDFGAVLREVARVLEPGGTLVAYGVHPCFNGPCIENRPDGARVVHPTYRRAGWHEAAPWWTEGGVRHRIGMRHVPLAELVNGFVAAGLAVAELVEPRNEPLPYALAVRAYRPA
jgi:ubiquinone/menaquinone biosynthesis C-methylase UbiE